MGVHGGRRSSSILSKGPTPLYTTAITPTSVHSYWSPKTVGGSCNELSPPSTGASSRDEEMVILVSFPQSGVATIRAASIMS